MQSFITENIESFLKSKQFKSAIIEHGEGKTSFYSYTHFFCKDKKINLYREGETIYIDFFDGNKRLYQDKYELNDSRRKISDSLVFDLQVFCQDFFDGQYQ